MWTVSRSRYRPAHRTDLLVCPRGSVSVSCVSLGLCLAPPEPKVHRDRTGTRGPGPGARNDEPYSQIDGLCPRTDVTEFGGPGSMRSHETLLFYLRCVENEKSVRNPLARSAAPGARPVRARGVGARSRAGEGTEPPRPRAWTNADPSTPPIPPPPTRSTAADRSPTARHTPTHPGTSPRAGALQSRPHIHQRPAFQFQC